MKADKINSTIQKYGNSMEHLMLILRDLETQSGRNVLDERVLRSVAEQMNIPEDTLDLILGRSFAELLPIFGFRVTEEPDGTKCLVADEK